MWEQPWLKEDSIIWIKGKNMGKGRKENENSIREKWGVDGREEGIFLLASIHSFTVCL